MLKAPIDNLEMFSSFSFATEQLVVLSANLELNFGIVILLIVPPNI